MESSFLDWVIREDFIEIVFETGFERCSFMGTNLEFGAVEGILCPREAVWYSGKNIGFGSGDLRSHPNSAIH